MQKNYFKKIAINYYVKKRFTKTKMFIYHKFNFNSSGDLSLILFFQFTDKIR
jgi:hypothetical protein